MKKVMDIEKRTFQKCQYGIVILYQLNFVRIGMRLCDNFLDELICMELFLFWANRWQRMVWPHIERSQRAYREPASRVLWEEVAGRMESQSASLEGHQAISQVIGHLEIGSGKENKCTLVFKGKVPVSQWYRIHKTNQPMSKWSDIAVNDCIARQRIRLGLSVSFTTWDEPHAVFGRCTLHTGFLKQVNRHHIRQGHAPVNIHYQSIDSFKA